MLTFLESNLIEENANRAKELEMMEATRVQDTKPSHPLSDFVGSYTDSMYGSIEITAATDGLGLQFIQTPLFKAELKHWHYDTFQLNWSEQMMLPSGMVHFTIDAMGKVEALDVNVPNPDFDFTELHFVRD
jgi:hypothetical protein